MKKLDLPPDQGGNDPRDSSESPDQPLITRFEHLVQFYESDDFLADRVSEFIAEGFSSDEAGIVIGTPEHRQGLEKRLSEQGFNVAALKEAGQFFSLDAADTLSLLMANDSPDEALFQSHIGPLLSQAARGGRRNVRAFGEMVALLWADGKREAAVQLEELWNRLSQTHAFSLLCAYPMKGFSGAPCSDAFGDICHAHSEVLPTENYVKSCQNEVERLRTIASLEQKAKSLDSEIEKNKGIEERGRLLAAIVESSDDAIISKDLNGIITSWNKGAERIFGYQAHEITGHSVLELIPPERQHEEPVILARLRNGLRIDHYETIRRRKDGTDVEVSLTVSPIKDETGKTVGASKIARDITDRKRNESQQQALYELTSAINRAVALPEVYENSIDAICRSQNAPRAAILLYDAEGTMRFKAWRNLSDEYRRAVEGHSPWKRDDSTPQPVCINDVQAASLDDHLKAVVSREGIRSLVFLPISYEGRLLGKFMVYYNAPHKFTMEELRPAQTIVNQVSFAIERRRAGENLERMVNERTASLREAIAQMEEFSYSVSHDLRAPVRAMQCYAEVLMEDYGSQLDEHAKKYLERIIQGGSRMDRLIQDILTYSRLSRREIRLQPISLDKLTREIVRQYLDLSASTRAEISVDGKLPTVLGHEASLSQAISNLLNNAVKFVAPGTTPRVRLSTERVNGDVRLWIEDNGIGIKPEYQHRLFSVFERVHPEKNYEGTGIGLAIVRKAAERMGGKVGVESDGKNGSRFWIQLPASENS
ncbi:MAG TPA: PAS domain S-box protein [Verrucomicrobiae bacterium]|jgi:PAS domain S-box-containing protein|nr:PAS domain S-box protein [Verrucomicrobiae bacterium]